MKHFSVIWPTVNGVAAFLMIQGHALTQINGTGNELLIRTAPLGTWGLQWQNYFFADEHTMIKNIGSDLVVGGVPAGIDPPCALDEGNYPAPEDGEGFFNGQVYQQVAQWDVSNHPANTMLASYYCSRVNHNLESSNVTPFNCGSSEYEYWRGTFHEEDVPPFSQGTNFTGRVRFYNQDLTRVNPWCTSQAACDMPMP